MILNLHQDYALEVIDPAVISEKKIKPNKLMVVIAGALTSLMLSLLYVLARHEKKV